jgi:hypothetical protein
VKERQAQRQTAVRTTYELPVDTPPDSKPILSLDGRPVSPFKGAPAPPASPKVSKKGGPAPKVSEKGGTTPNVSKKGGRTRVAAASIPNVIPPDASTDTLIDTATPPDTPTPPSLVSRVPPGTDDMSSVSTVRRSTRSTKGTFQTPHFRDQAFSTFIDRFSDPHAGHEAQLAYLADGFTCTDTGAMDITDPRAYAAKLRGDDADKQ